jgi:Short C-terminal domain
MRRFSSVLGLLVIVAAAVLCQSLAAFAEGPSDLCGNDPNCTVEGDPFDADSGTGIPGGFIALMVVVVLIGIGLTLYRISVARGMAEKSGMDPGDATRVALLDDDGLSATYLASQMRGRQVESTSTPPSTPPSPTRSTADRLRELESLHDQGLVTDDEYAERRTAILGEV